MAPERISSSLVSDFWLHHLQPRIVSPRSQRLVLGIVANSDLALSFLINGPADMATGWTWLTPAQRSAVKADYTQAGIKIMVSGTS